MKENNFRKFTKKTLQILQKKKKVSCTGNKKINKTVRKQPYQRAVLRQQMNDHIQVSKKKVKGTLQVARKTI